MIRLSVALESSDDLIQDLVSALDSSRARSSRTTGVMTLTASREDA